MEAPFRFFNSATDIWRTIFAASITVYVDLAQAAGISAAATPAKICARVQISAAKVPGKQHVRK